MRRSCARQSHFRSRSARPHSALGNLYLALPRGQTLEGPNLTQVPAQDVWPPRHRVQDLVDRDTGKTRHHAQDPRDPRLQQPGRGAGCSFCACTPFLIPPCPRCPKVPRYPIPSSTPDVARSVCICPPPPDSSRRPSLFRPPSSRPIRTSPRGPFRPPSSRPQPSTWCSATTAAGRACLRAPRPTQRAHSPPRRPARPTRRSRRLRSARDPPRHDAGIPRRTRIHPL